MRPWVRAYWLARVALYRAREKFRGGLVVAIVEEGERIKASAAAYIDPCWCGRHHRPGYWHDPTYGRIDRDIQDWTEKNFPGISLATKVAIENNAQRLRDQGLRP